MLAFVLAMVCGCVYVCMSVTPQYSVEMTKLMIMQTVPHVSPRTLSFSHQNLLLGEIPIESLLIGVANASGVG